MSSDALVPIGKIIGVHGIKGNLKLYAYAESPDSIRSDQTAYLHSADGDSKTVTIGWAKPFKRNVMLIGLESNENRTQAESLVGLTLSVAEGVLPPLEADTYYWKDLIGISVYESEGGCLGVLKQILPTGSNDVYIVENEDREILIPALKSVVLSVDLAGKTMTVSLPEGL